MIRSAIEGKQTAIMKFASGLPPKATQSAFAGIIVAQNRADSLVGQDKGIIMTASKWSTASTLAVLILATGLLLGYKAAAPEPAVVAAVQLGTLWIDLKERVELQAELDRWKRELEDELDRRREAIEALQAQRDWAVDETQRTQLNEQLAMAELTLKYWGEITSREVRTVEALRYRALYLHIIQAVDELAKREGYDLVVLNDAGGEFRVDPQSRVPAHVQVLQQIASRKILYADRRIDITDELLDRMNNAWRAAAAR